MWFDMNCEEAINLYVSIFASVPGANGESKIESIMRYPERQLDGPPPGMAGKVLTAIFYLGGQKFMALDGGPYFKPTGAVSFLVECDDQAQVDHFWDKLGEGGDPNAQQCGWLTDKFGFSWQISPKRLGELLSDPDKATADRAMDAMLKMKKIVIADLEKAAYNG